MTKKERDRMSEERICFVCLGKIPDGDGTYDGELGILTHSSECSDISDKARRSFEQSSRGRWRPPGQVRKILEDRRKMDPKG